MSERTGKHWWTMTGRLGFAARLGALVTALALGAVTGIVWLSPSGATPGTPKTEAELRLEREVADLEAVLADRDQELAAIERGQAKAKAERAAGAERGKEKAAQEKAAAAAAGQEKAAAERAAAAEAGRKKAAAERAAAEKRGKEKAAVERRLALALGDAKGAAIREAVAKQQAAASAAARAAAAAAAANPPKPTAPALSALLEPEHRYFGLYTAQSPFNWSEVDDVSSKVGVAPDMAGYFQGWDTPFRPDAVTRSWQKGMLPFLTWESRPMAADNNTVEEPAYSLPRIIDGAYDDYLREYARGVRDLGLPMAIRLNHEMNGAWYPWAEQGYNGKPVNGNRRGDFVRMWRHVHDIFEAEGANAYVIWVWAPNRVDRLPAANQSIDYTRSLYPGDEYVDWVGMSGYYRPPFDQGEVPTFDNTFGKTLTQLRTISRKPVLLAEIGASENGGEKPQWITDLFDRLAEPQNGDILGMAWFHHAVTTVSQGQLVTNDWRITSRSDSQAAFTDGIHDPAAAFLPGTVRATTAATVFSAPLQAPAAPAAAEEPAPAAPVQGPATPAPAPAPSPAGAGPTPAPTTTTRPGSAATPTPAPTR